MNISEFNKKYTPGGMQKHTNEKGEEKELYVPGSAVKYIDEKGQQKEAFLRWPAEILPDSQRAVVWLGGVLEAVDFNKIII